MELAQWTRQHPAPVIAEDRYALYRFVNSSVGAERLDYLEFGVWYGRSIKYWADINRHVDSRFFGFDSFVGLPEAWNGGTTESRDKGAFDRAGEPPGDVDDARVHFVKGWFQDTLGRFLERATLTPPLVIHIDSDLYTSALYCLTMLDRVAASGTVVVFDQFHAAAHEFRAFRDYVAAYRREYAVVAAVGRMPYLQIAIRLGASVTSSL